MSPFLAGFTDELQKLGAFPQHHEDAGAYDSGSGVQAAIERTQGASAKTGLKLPPIQPASSVKKRAPTPLTSPNSMVNYTAGQG